MYARNPESASARPVLIKNRIDLDEDDDWVMRSPCAYEADDLRTFSRFCRPAAMARSLPSLVNVPASFPKLPGKIGSP